jgi:hypothetical protein
MKELKLPKTLNQVRKELANVYYLARVARNRTQLEQLRLMKDALRAQVQAAATAHAVAKFEGRELPSHWLKFIYGK